MNPFYIGDDMNLCTLSVEETRGVGNARVSCFAIPIGREADAARELLELADSGHEISLMNGCDEGGEGLNILKGSATGLVMKQAGHGWTGAWESDTPM